MAGFLYYVTTPFVSKEALSENKLRQIARDAYDNLHVLVLDEEVEVVKADEQELYRHMPHRHVSTEDESCDFCYDVISMDENFVPTPDDLV